ncbi:MULTISPECIES: 30S ribosomal protein S4 [Leptospira]|uniref:Small ribosomal subunit protein uS4 n=2 Tax=Leptospira TaxID=171 RepID=A0AAW5VL20_9LEPT|nr:MULTISPECIES: 30S ribosomal protein S4 [Leptospira]EKJ88735.1 ribosomal protein S4 [Leptospira meyeri serovar Hardjo str. Went 5]EMJ86751.1 ribosomal protein S4 [Leptospira meyeri serovar Semaranga str. Veldrot Semarang 173]MCW7490308.1 30S ribosomal protein S4 [Leptospira meyeri]MCW7493252.1 30S ribosomal protein S4 [Leptospira soteropolitanensis]MCW7500679.1 30S ribosomal protein S4 [Leptospira soteropolitanensis]
MARYRGPVVKLMRREGLNLFLKNSHTLHKEKSSLEKRKYPPGLPPKKKGKVTEYGAQLREKQKVKRAYGVLEKQFRRYFEEASHTPGIPGENLLQFLERRLDNVLYRMGFAVTRRQARNFVAHRHILVNGHRVDICSYRVNVGDKIEIREKFQKSAFIEENIKLAQAINRTASWVSVDYTKFSGEVTSLPTREHIDIPVKEQVIVELYSK